MNIYERKTRWKLWLMLAALLIVFVSLWYTNKLARNLAKEERKKVALWASALKKVNEAGPETDIGFLFEVINNNETVPVILADEEDNIIAHRNLDSLKAATKERYLQKKLVEMKAFHEPIVIDIAEGQKNFIYYQDSYLLTQLRYYPYIQFGIIGIFLLVGYLAFSTARKAEQNQVWVGMARETAHQLGTPLSSLSAWIEHLKASAKNEQTNQIAGELESDVNRLELIAERFSKIGSAPKLKEYDLEAVILKTVAYVKRRASHKVQINVQKDVENNEQIKAKLNTPLFDWVIENLLKNALDAMEGEGKVTIKLFKDKKYVNIDITDSGKGIPKNKFKTIFNPGYSTKKRGWGLGLSLSKRIIENYHSGRIFVKESAKLKGTTFSILLPR